MKKKITIVTSAYRSEPYLMGYLENMVRLTNRDEVVIILLLNDPSSQEIELSQSFEKRWPDLFQVHCTERETIGASLNRGLRAANTPYVAYADVDDRRPPDAFERQLATLENFSDAMFTYGDFIVVKKPEDIHGRHVQTPEFDPLEFTRSSCVGPGHFFRKTLLERTGYFDEQLRSGADFEFQIRAAFNCRFQKTPGIVAYYLMNNSLPSASKTPWQRIESCVIYLRYGICDKINYDYAAMAALYHVPVVFYEGKWVPVKQLIPNYDATIQLRHSQWTQLGIRNYLRKKHFFGKIGQWMKRVIGKTQRDGFVETFQTALKILQARQK
jgi:glycosyltransferase involved in cell wall biosynthesis